MRRQEEDKKREQENSPGYLSTQRLGIDRGLWPRLLNARGRGQLYSRNTALVWTQQSVLNAALNHDSTYKLDMTDHLEPLEADVAGDDIQL